MHRIALALAAALLALAGCEPGVTYTRDVASHDSAADAADARRDAPIDSALDVSADTAADAGDAAIAVDIVAPVDIVTPVDVVAPADVPVDAGSPAVCPPVGAMDCSPGSGTGMADQCVSGTSCYLARVQAAVRAVIAENPTWFDYSMPSGCPNILNVDGFMNAVVDHMVAAGLCCIRDPNAPGEEITVKFNNAYSENFDIVASTGCARYGGLIYTGYCAPAWW